MAHQPLLAESESFSDEIFRRVERAQSLDVTEIQCPRCGILNQQKTFDGRTFEQLWRAGRIELCRNCSRDTQDKQCGSCNQKIDRTQDNWRSGLCEKCYETLPKCKGCARRLKVSELKFKTGLCDPCYNSCRKKCIHCKRHAVTLGQPGWMTGMCQDCASDKNEVQCSTCSQSIPLQDRGWRTGICNSCYDKRGGCRSSVSRGREHIRLCDACYNSYNRICVRCNETIPDDELWYTSGLCDFCYKDCHKVCLSCKEKIPLKQLRWGSGLCDKCYNDSKFRMQCQLCNESIMKNDGPDPADDKAAEQSDAVHGARLCGQCFKKLTDAKTCDKCHKRNVFLGDPYYALGLCPKCVEGVLPQLLSNGKKYRARSHSLTEAPVFYAAKQKAIGPSVTLYRAKSKVLLTERGQALKVKDVSTWRWFQFLALGVSGWFASNAVFASLPMFVQKLPEGARTASLVNGSTQIGAVCAILFHVVENNKTLNERESIPETDEAIELFDFHSKLNEKRRRFKEEKQEKKAAADSADKVHMLQVIAVFSLAIFILAWMWDQQTPELVVLAAVAGAVGNVADLIVWPIALPYPSSYAAAIQIGGSLSGVLPNMIEAYLAPFGIVPYLMVVVIMQVGFWTAISTEEVAGPAPKHLLPSMEKKVTKCQCRGCDSCIFSEDQGLLKSAAKAAEREKQFVISQETGRVTSTDSGSALGSWKTMAQRFRKALSGGDNEKKEPGRVAFYTGSSFVSRAMGYTVPSLLPFISKPYTLRQQLLYERMNTMYNVGNVLGRMLCQWYKPEIAGLALSFALVTCAFIFLCICSACPELLNRSVSEATALWFLPLIVGIFNLSIGLMSTGLFVQAHEDATKGKRVPKTIQATMGFYGQIGCVSGNMVIFIIINVLHLL